MSIFRNISKCRRDSSVMPNLQGSQLYFAVIFWSMSQIHSKRMGEEACVPREAPYEEPLRRDTSLCIHITRSRQIMIQHRCPITLPLYPSINPHKYIPDTSAYFSQISFPLPPCSPPPRRSSPFATFSEPASTFFRAFLSFSSSVSRPRISPWTPPPIASAPAPRRTRP